MTCAHGGKFIPDVTNAAGTWPAPPLFLTVNSAAMGAQPQFTNTVPAQGGQLMLTLNPNANACATPGMPLFVQFPQEPA